MMVETGHPSAAKVPTWWRRALALLGAGVAGGLLTAGLEMAALWATQGFTLSMTGAMLGVYLLSGLALAAVAAIASRWPRCRLKPSTLTFLVVALLEASAMTERVFHAVFNRPLPLIFLACCSALAGYALWIAILRWLFGRRRAGALAWALALGSITIAAGLAVNRNLISELFSLTALLADIGIVLTVALTALGLGRGGRLRPAMAAGLAVALATVAIWGHGLSMSGIPTSGSQSLQSRASHPSLVMVIIDTLRHDVFQQVLEETPEGRAFARATAGTARFENAVAVAPWTAPSVATIMTGLWPPEHGYGYQEQMSRDLKLTRLTPEVRTLAEMLEARGYATTALIANPVLGIGSGLERGFERFELLTGRTSRLPLLTLAERLGLLPRELYLNASGVRRRLAHHVDDLAADSRPDFLWLHLMDPHEPLNSHPGLPEEAGLELSESARLYRDEVRYCLSELTQMVEMLRESKMWQDSVFVMVADHGEMFAEDERGPMLANPRNISGHGHALFGELVRVPLMIRPAGSLIIDRQLEVLTSQVDLLTTLADLLDLDLPLLEDDRYSLAPWLASQLTEGSPPSRRYAMIGANHSGPPQRALRSSSRKLIRYQKGQAPKRLLFDLESDPLERQDLAGQEPLTTGEMTEILDLAWGSLDRAESESIEIDAETREQLKALGYVD